MAKQQSLGRLAMRAEGSTWNAYYAQIGTMEDAIFLASIKLAIVQEHSEYKDAFLTLMTEVVASMIEKAVGIKPTWNSPQGAPEHERSGNA